MLVLRAGVGLTFSGAEPGHFLRHQRSLLVFAVDLDDLLPTLAAFGSGQSRDGLLPADLTLRLLLPRFPTGWRLSPGGVPLGSLRSGGDGGHLGEALPDEGVVVSVAPGADGGVLEDLVGSFCQHARRLGVLGRFGPSAQVAVAVNAVKILGDRVLVVVAVQVRLLLWPVGTVDVLRRRG